MGKVVGEVVGVAVGLVGAAVGVLVGEVVGLLVGATVGAGVGAASSSSVYVLRNELQQASLCGVHTVQRPSLSAMQTDLSHALVLHIASRRILRCTRMPNAAREYFKHRIQSLST